MLKITCVMCGAVAFGPNKSQAGKRPEDGIKRLSEITSVKIERIVTGFADRNWGTADNPGIAFSSVTMVGGAPGAGKSTLCLQLLAKIAHVVGRPGLYVGAEESAEQIKDRASRLGLNLDDILILSLEDQASGHRLTRAVFEAWNPSAFVLDSLQKYSESDDDAVDLCSQIKEISILRRCPAFVISQVNKEEEFAGSNKAQHEVDALILFLLTDAIEDATGKVHYPPVNKKNPDNLQPFRVLKTGKNRFGDSFESYFTMHDDGLRPFSIRPKK